MAGDEIKIVMPEESSYFPPEDIPFEIVFEDDDLMVIDKPAGYVVHPTHGFPEHTIANGISKYMHEVGRPFKIRFINRLDMDTSGLLALAKNAYTQDGYMRQQRDNLVKKEYTAIVFGVIDSDTGVIDAPIGKPDPAAPFRGVTPDGKPSVTHYEVIERIDSSLLERGFSIVRLRLETGRTHQIRVHMGHMGHKIVGDEFYDAEAPGLIDRQALHASRLSFKHPVTGKKLDFHSPLPDDMQALIQKIK